MTYSWPGNVRELANTLEGLTLLAPGDEILPEEVTVNKLLMSFCRGLIAPDPIRRFPSAEAADYVQGGAAAFHRQLVLTDLATEYDNDIRLWLEELREMDEPGSTEL